MKKVVFLLAALAPALNGMGYSSRCMTESRGASSVVSNVRELQSTLAQNGFGTQGELLECPRVYSVLQAHNDFSSALFAMMNNSVDLETAFSTNLHPMPIPKALIRTQSRDDLQHVAKVESQIRGWSLASLAPRLTLLRYHIERLEAEYPRTCNLLLTAWSLTAQASAVRGAAAALYTGGASMIAFGTSFGISLGLDYIADLVNEYGAEIIANNTCNGDQRLKASYEKTFLFVGAIATKYGIKSVTGKGWAERKGLKPTVQPINNRAPLNSHYAGKAMSAGEIDRKIQNRYTNKKMQIRPPYYQYDIPFTAAGHPDFSRYAVRKVKIGVTGKNDVDQRSANKAAGYKSTPSGYVWHHHEDCGTMLLIPIELHETIRHTGSIAKMKK